MQIAQLNALCCGNSRVWTEFWAAARLVLVVALQKRARVFTVRCGVSNNRWAPSWRAPEEPKRTDKLSYQFVYISIDNVLYFIIRRCDTIFFCCCSMHDRSYLKNKSFLFYFLPSRKSNTISTLIISINPFQIEPSSHPSWWNCCR